MKRGYESLNTTIINTLRQKIEELKREKEFSSNILRSMPDGLVILDEEKKVIYMNKAFLERCGIEALGKRCFDAFGLREEFCRRCRLRRQGRIEQTCASEVIDRKGRTFEVSDVIIHLPEGKRACLQIHKDISALKEAQDIAREAQEMYHAIADHMPGMAYRGLPSENWAAKWVGAWIEDFAGYSVKDITEGKVNWFDIIHPQDKARAMRESKALFKRPTTLIQEYRIFKKDGTIAWVQDKKRSIFKGKKVAYIDGIVLDITKQREAEEALSYSEHLYSTLVEQARDAIVIIEDGKWSFVNKAMLDITGYSEEELIGKRFIGFIAPEDRKRVSHRYAQKIRGKHIESVASARIICKDGKTKHMEATSKLTHRDGRRALLAVMRDVTEHRAKDEQNKELMMRLRMKNRIMDCIMHVQAIRRKRQMQTREILERAAAYTLHALRYPKQAAVRFVLDKESVTTKGYRNTPHNISHSIRTGGRTRGAIDIYYPAEVQFLDEEKELIGRIGKEIPRLMQK